VNNEMAHHLEDCPLGDALVEHIIRQIQVLFRRDALERGASIVHGPLSLCAGQSPASPDTPTGMAQPGPAQPAEGGGA
jgi:hypothetical protein